MNLATFCSMSAAMDDKISQRWFPWHWSKRFKDIGKIPEVTWFSIIPLTKISFNLVTNSLWKISFFVGAEKHEKSCSIRNCADWYKFVSGRMYRERNRCDTRNITPLGNEGRLWHWSLRKPVTVYTLCGGMHCVAKVFTSQMARVLFAISKMVLSDLHWGKAKLQKETKFC